MSREAAAMHFVYGKALYMACTQYGSSKMTNLHILAALHSEQFLTYTCTRNCAHMFKIVLSANFVGFHL